ncbi:hypothetical protein BRADI_4g18369v3 [Brachypodium distachyon]|uniref:PB1-like domain-containing protein n=1 Tax=Brachypodium distachyon TaxID=15368 RepID=A0A2K2CNL6_BRADI|nr:hypothetical protein BRADI_4g18369v3 [Brachypodium distachyon]
MAPLRRLEGNPPPVYEDWDRRFLFSLCINHGGFFVGSGTNRSYVDGRKIWYDFIDGEKWSLADVETIVEEIGYEMAGRVKAYWLVPGKEANNLNGLVQISSAAVTDLPKVFSPKKTTYLENRSEALPAFYKVANPVIIQSNSESSDSESGGEEDFIDSDYEISDGDDDLGEDVIDEDEASDKGKGKAVQQELSDNEYDAEDDMPDEGDHLRAPGSDDEGAVYNFKSFNEEDTHNPVFKYSCKMRVDIKLPINDTQRISASCDDGCPWRMWASYDSRTKCMALAVILNHGR